MLNSNKNLSLDWTKVHDCFPIEKHLQEELNSIIQAKRSLLEKSGPNAAMTGWLNYVDEHAQTILSQMAPLVKDIQSHSDAVVIIGIGGSYLGARAIYDSLTHSYASLKPELFHKKPILFWAGHHLSTDELVELLDVLDHFTPSLVVISKSGNTTEPALSFRLLKKYLDERFGAEEARHRIFAVTDSNKGTLLKLCKENGYAHLPIPDDIGGRYSVFTAVGLFPLAIAGIDVQELLKGVYAAKEDCASPKNNSLETNPALCYAAIRNILYRNQFKTEVFCAWSQKLRNLSEWWKQLFGESDGKEHSGIFPSSAIFTTDLHSLGQYFQDGERNFFATHLRVQDEYSLAQGSIKRKLSIPDAQLNDNFDFVLQKDLSDIQHDAQNGTFLAHCDGKLPTLVWEIPEINPFWLGYFMFTQFFSCAVGAYVRGINPFDQNGVEEYKNNMYALLGKPEFSHKASQIKKRIQTNQRLKSVGITSKN